MNPAVIALILYVVGLGGAFGLRTWLMVRRTGTTGFKGLSGPAGSAGWVGGVLFVVALLAAVAAPVLQLLGLIEPVDVLDRQLVHIVGGVIAVVGILGTLWAQQAMGDSWRVGVDESEHTELVRSGAFGLVRNPIFTAMITAALGLAMLTPNLVAIVAVVALLVAIQLQVRAVEEPYLLAEHPSSYASYAAKVGRFLPGVGRLRFDSEGR